MKITFRWYGKEDPIPLSYIRQIPCMSGVVSAVYDTPPGEVWSKESIQNLVDACHQEGLACEVIESVPVHEDIKLGLATRDQYLENYRENIRRLAESGVKCICYNFMPVFDWLRSELNKQNADGSNALSYRHQDVLAMNPLVSELSLPGWDQSYSKAEMQQLLQNYSAVDEETLWQNLEYFLKAVIPTAEECGVKMAIHPDDPPWGIFGLPRIITSKQNILRFLKLVDTEANGITLCTGSLGVARSNDLIEIAEAAAGRVHFVHLRNVKITGEHDFEEVAHPSCCGDVDMHGVLKTLLKNGFDGYIRPDHGRMIWGEKGRHGYGLFDRALGAAYIAGLYEAIVKDGIYE